jgi:hypothetical protein
VRISWWGPDGSAEDTGSDLQCRGYDGSPFDGNSLRLKPCSGIRHEFTFQRIRV